MATEWNNILDTPTNTEWDQVANCALNDLDFMQDENWIILQDEVWKNLKAHFWTLSCKNTDWNNTL